MDIVKNIARYLIYFIKRKKYKYKLDSNVTLECFDCEHETFFGYYDKSPEINNKILFHQKIDDGLEVKVFDIDNNKISDIAKVGTFNWQMGARAIWIDDDIISYNDFDGVKYICRWYSLSKNSIIRTFSYPLLDSFKKDYFLGVNFQRLRSYAKEYAYYCLPELNEKEFNDYVSDGIWKVDVGSGNCSLLISINDVLNCKRSSSFDNSYHFLNHVMISPSGKSFIFIHRYYYNGDRYDRLMYYDFKALKCLFDGKMQSHFCWIDDTSVFGYGEYNNRLGFYTINVDSLSVEFHDKLTILHPKDGHPTKYGNWIVIDSYPDLSRMQSLIAYNIKTHDIISIGEFFHDLRHKGCTRCDLHPRFSVDGKSIYIDSIFSGKRHLCRIKLNGLLSE